MKKLIIAVLLTPLMVSAAQKKPSPLDGYEDEVRFQRDLDDLLSTFGKGAPSPNGTILAKLAHECDANGSKSPKISAIKEIVKEQTPLTPLALTRSVSSMRPIAVKIAQH